jgi:3D-(3,5/4)-trihydroxycyclohexane-1,2-dione acylhydrolase (decyclizing)
MAQALVRFLANQYVERDGEERRFFAGCFGIFGHGNVAGVGQALLEYGDDLTYYQSRNEQAMVHTAAAYARQKNRLQTMACTSSIGPGATNMVTGAALATINRLPVLLLPGDVFASRGPDPVLQQLEAPHDGDLSVNDAFRPVSRYWDRVNRPEQIIPAALAAMRVLTNPAETGTVTLALPQDVQAEAYDYPEEFFEKRVWRVGRPLPDAAELERARRPYGRQAAHDRGGRRHDLLRSHGGAARLRRADRHTRRRDPGGQGLDALRPPARARGRGRTGTFAANRAAREADVVIGVGTRWSDFTTASKTAFQNPDVRFVNVNVADLDAVKHAASASSATPGRPWRPSTRPRRLRGRGRVPGGEREANAEWDAEVERLYSWSTGRCRRRARS